MTPTPWNPAAWPSHSTVPVRIYGDGATTEGVLHPEQGFPVRGEQGARFVVTPLLHPSLPSIAPPSHYAVEGHLLRPGVNTVYGVPKLGKSRFIQQLALSLLLDRLFLGQFNVTRGPTEPVLLMLAEEAVNRVRRSVAAQCEGLGLRPEEVASIMPLLRAVPPAAFRLFNQLGEPLPDFDTLARVLDSERPAAFFLDTLSDSLGFAAEGGSDSMRNVLSHFRRLALEFNVAIGYVDHEGHAQRAKDGTLHKMGRPRGSSQKIGAADTLVRLDREGAEADNPRCFHVEVTTRDAPLAYRYKAHFGEDGDEQRFEFAGFDVGASDVDRLRVALAAIAEAERAKGGPLKAGEVADVLKGAKDKRLATRNWLAAQGYLNNLQDADASDTAPGEWTVTEKGRVWLG
jgi:hypothetical protein